MLDRKRMRLQTRYTKERTGDEWSCRKTTAGVALSESEVVLCTVIVGAVDGVSGAANAPSAAIL